MNALNSRSRLVATLVALMLGACGGGDKTADEPVELAGSTTPAAVPAANTDMSIQAVVAGSLSGTVSTAASTASLTSAGTSDWAHWGDGVPGLVRRSGGGAQIGAYTLVGGGTPASFNNSPRTLTWTNGTPTASSAANTNGLYMAGGGYSITLPASTVARVATVYVGGWNSGATLTAHLSDGSAADYVHVNAATTGIYVRTYVISYKAGAASQTLTLTWQRTAGTGNVDLNAVAMSLAAPSGASLSGVVSTAATSINLSGTGLTDWAHWGDGGVPSITRKSGGGSLISAYTVLSGGAASSYNNDPRAMSWAGGTPTASATANTNGVYMANVGNGFSVNVPAGLSQTAVTIYVGGWASSGTLRAHLSDSSVADYTNTTAVATGQYVRAYTITYAAASTGPAAGAHLDAGFGRRQRHPQWRGAGRGRGFEPRADHHHAGNPKRHARHGRDARHQRKRCRWRHAELQRHRLAGRPRHQR